MPTRSLLTIIIIAVSLSAAAGLALVQVSMDGSRVLAAPRGGQALIALQEAMSPGQVQALRSEELSGVLREVERQATRCLGSLSPTTRVLLAPQGVTPMLQGLCDERAALAEELISQLRSLPTGDVQLGELEPQEVAAIGAQVALIGALTRGYDDALGGAHQLSLAALVATVLALGLLLTVVATRALMGFLRAVVATTNMALEQSREAPALALLDRRELRSQLEQALADVGRAPGDKASALFVFTLERPEWAHGDGADERWREVLNQAQQRLAERVRGDDLACALVSDELVLLARRVGDAEQAAMLGQRLKERLDVPCEVQGKRYQPAIYGGFAMYPDHAIDADALVRNAEKAMREARREGVEQPLCFCIDSRAVIDERSIIEQGLRHALECGELSLVYQPVVNLTEQSSKSVEALLRWHHPALGEVPPSKFIPVAEKSDLILPISEWVLTEAMRQVRQWRDEGEVNVRASVNVSVRQLTGQDLVTLVQDTLAKFDLGGDALLLEVTESLLMQERERAWDVLAQMREEGVRIALDDVGTGYSSLSYLSGMPLDYLKIDRSFLGEHSEEQRPTIHTIIGLARALNVGVVAEGVEDDVTAAFLMDAGVQFAQGYLFNHPVPAAQIDWDADYSHHFPQEGDLERLLSAW